MVIRHDDVDPDFPRVCDFFAVGNSAIYRDEQFRTIFGLQEIESGLIDAVTFFVAVRNICRGLDADTSQCFLEKRGCGDAVRVIISVYNNAFLVFFGFFYALDNFSHAFQAEWIMQIRVRRVEKFVDIFSRKKTSRSKQSESDRIEADFFQLLRNAGSRFERPIHLA